jgi:hypothetical protein
MLTKDKTKEKRQKDKTKEKRQKIKTKKTLFFFVNLKTMPL